MKLARLANKNSRASSSTNVPNKDTNRTNETKDVPTQPTPEELIRMAESLMAQAEEEIEGPVLVAGTTSLASGISVASEAANEDEEASEASSVLVRTIPQPNEPIAPTKEGKITMVDAVTYVTHPSEEIDDDAYEYHKLNAVPTKSMLLQKERENMMADQTQTANTMEKVGSWAKGKVTVPNTLTKTMLEAKMKGMGLDSFVAPSPTSSYQLLTHCSGGKALSGIIPSFNDWKKTRPMLLLRAPCTAPVAQTSHADVRDFELHSMVEARAMSTYVSMCGTSSIPEKYKTVVGRGFLYFKKPTDEISSSSSLRMAQEDTETEGIANSNGKVNCACNLLLKSIKRFTVTMPDSSQLRLSEDALDHLRRVLDLFNYICTTKNKNHVTREKLNNCLREFFENFGSHIFQGPVSFGGVLHVRGEMMSKNEMFSKTAHAAAAIATSKAASIMTDQSLNSEGVTGLLDGISDMAGSMGDVATGAAEAMSNPETAAMAGVSKGAQAFTKMGSSLMKTVSNSISKNESDGFLDSEKVIENHLSEAVGHVSVEKTWYGGIPTDNIKDWTSSILDQSEINRLDVFDRGSNLIPIWKIVENSWLDLGKIKDSWAILKEISLGLSDGNAKSTRDFENLLDDFDLVEINGVHEEANSDGVVTSTFQYYQMRHEEIKGTLKRRRREKDERWKTLYNQWAKHWILIVQKHISTSTVVLSVNEGCGSSSDSGALDKFANYLEQEWHGMYDQQCTCNLTGRQLLPSMMKEHTEITEAVTKQRMNFFHNLRQDDKHLYDELMEGHYILRKVADNILSLKLPKIGFTLMQKVRCLACDEYVPAVNLKEHAKYFCKCTKLVNNIEWDLGCTEPPDNFVEVDGKLKQVFIPLRRNLDDATSALLDKGHAILFKAYNNRDVLRANVIDTYAPFEEDYFVRIKHISSKFFLKKGETETVNVGQFTEDQWRLVPVQFKKDTYYIIHRASNGFLDSQGPGTFVRLWGNGKDTGDNQQHIQWKLIPVPLKEITYYIMHSASNSFLNSHGHTTSVQEWNDRDEEGPENIQWKLPIPRYIKLDVVEDYFYTSITHVQSQGFLGTEGNIAKVGKNMCDQWRLVPVQFKRDTYYIIHQLSNAFLDSRGRGTFVQVWGAGNDTGKEAREIQWQLVPLAAKSQKDTYFIIHCSSNAFLESEGQTGVVKVWGNGMEAGKRGQNIQWKLHKP